MGGILLNIATKGTIALYETLGIQFATSHFAGMTAQVGNKGVYMYIFILYVYIFFICIYICVCVCVCVCLVCVYETLGIHPVCHLPFFAGMTAQVTICVGVNVECVCVLCAINPSNKPQKSQHHPQHK